MTGDMRGCTDPEHAFGCPCGVGGDPIPRQCYLCKRRDPNDIGVVVEIEGDLRLVCDTCWERGQEGIDIPLDMTEDLATLYNAADLYISTASDEGFEIPLDMTEDREGWPEFNGAFR